MSERRSTRPRDDDDRPRRRRYDDEPEGRPVWPVFALAIGGGVIVLAGAVLAFSFLLTRPPDDPEQPSNVVIRTTGGQMERVDWSKVGTTAQVGDVTVEALWASPQTITGERFGDKVTYGTLTAVKFRFRNHSKTRLVRFGGWDRELEAADEHGNQYRTGGAFGEGFVIDKRPELSPAQTKAEDAGCETDRLVAGRTAFEPSRSYTLFLFHEKVVPAAKEVRLTVDAKELGGNGLLRFRVPLRMPQR
jgi:hypothetical protein